ncbi:hypothetical protein EVG20_g5965 [Dentipellis fragilis]|uniref:HCP-like protein n=1 Tax=Dentipellis fragilis TaxID=205917 RepID=A0A4Y9YQD3_9AGAM|nr:hypothetical protein EVG20_g5965 [Dentipellis fragilis]
MSYGRDMVYHSQSASPGAVPAQNRHQRVVQGDVYPNFTPMSGSDEPSPLLPPSAYFVTVFVRCHSLHPALGEDPSFTILQNRSVPSLPSEHWQAQDSAPDHVPSLPSYDPTAALDSFHALQISDSASRLPGAIPGGTEPFPRAASSMSAHSRFSQPRHTNSLPPHSRIVSTPAQTYPRDSRMSSETFNSQQGPYSDTSVGHDREGLLDNEHLYSTVESPAPPYDLAPTEQGPRFGPSSRPGVPGSGQYDPFFAAASDVLGMGPPGTVSVDNMPPGASPVNGVRQHLPVHLSSSQSVPALGLTNQPSQLYPNNSPHMHLQPSFALPDEPEFERRPALARSGTTASVTLQTQKTKAIDLRAPPYTKEYIDDYRQRIKADPDPEAHFAYAKYLIDAAKKFGADSKDQRGVRKYRDTLIQESLKVIRRLATHNQPFDEAQFFLANCHGTGSLGLQVDHEKAYHLYLQAAKQNHAAATYRVAVCNEIGAGTRKEPPRAAAFYRKAASLGDTAAMYKLGMILLQGTLGEARNPREAIGWLRRAAEQADEDNPHALHELALLHESPNGQLVPYDPLKAKELYTRAAYLGYTQSQYKLGQCYEYGTLGSPVDPRRSIAWYTKAAEKGNSEAELALSGWYLTGSEGVLKQSDSEAYLWARRAANKGLSKAEYAVGYYAEVGIGIKQDMDFAKRWYMRAAGTLQDSILFTPTTDIGKVQGNKRAMNRLTEMKRQGNKRANMSRPTRQQAKDECVIC